MIKNLFITAAIVLTGTFAQAETFQILRNDHLKGDNTIRIKQSVNQQLRARGLNPEDYQLDGVSLEAKSKRGKGTATLMVGQDQDTQRVPKALNDLFFDIDGDFTYHDMSWDLRGDEGQADERWQMRFRGNIKVDRLYAHVSTRVERIRIPMGDQVFRGANTLRIKRMLRDMGYVPRNMKLRRVVLVAKSRRGMGQAELTIAQASKGSKTVAMAQNGFDFQSNRPRSYDRLRWKVKGQTRGAWQINMNGRIKVKAVIVEVQ